MDVGHFYFLDDSYFVDFPDPKLMKNKEVINGIPHDRPCFFSFLDTKTQLSWLIPISSKVGKYKGIYQHKVNRFGNCITISFGYVLGQERAFLVQNMCPTSPKYVVSEYIDNFSQSPVRVNGMFEKQLIQNATTALVLTRQGSNLIFPDVLTIERKLLNNQI